MKPLIFNKEKIADISLCISPPYDVVQSLRSYYGRSRFNVIRLELPISLPSLSKYAYAQHTLQEWLREGVLVEDRGGIYVYEQRFTVEGRRYERRGFVALVKADRQRILVHERTKNKPKMDRKMLLSTLKTFTSLIFGLYEDREGRIEEILKGSRKEEIFHFLDEEGIENMLWRMEDLVGERRLIELMREKKIYIADGHHRLDVSFELCLPYIPMYLTSLYSDGLVILPYHRALRLPPSVDLVAALKADQDLFDVASYSFDGKSLSPGLKKEIADSPFPAFLLYQKETPSLLHLLTIKGDPLEGTNLPKPLRRLKVNILHKGILERFGIAENDVFFFHDEKKGIDLVRNGHFNVAIFLPPTRMEEVKEVAEQGLHMPPKSTFFFPKVPAGILFYRYE